MKRTMMLALLASLVACGDDGEPRAKATDPPRGAALAPRSCAEAPYGTVPAREGVVTVSAGRPATVGITVTRGRADYTIEQVVVQVLKAGADGRVEPWQVRPTDTVRRLERRGVGAGEHDFTFSFDGRDDEGRPLPPGRYAAQFLLRTEAAGTCDGPPASASGLLATIDWRG